MRLSAAIHNRVIHKPGAHQPRRQSASGCSFRLMLQSRLLRAPIDRFFDKQPVGRIMSRLVGDMRLGAVKNASSRVQGAWPVSRRASSLRTGKHQACEEPESLQEARAGNESFTFPAVKTTLPKLDTCPRASVDLSLYAKTLQTVTTVLATVTPLLYVGRPS